MNTHTYFDYYIEGELSVLENMYCKILKAVNRISSIPNSWNKIEITNSLKETVTIKESFVSSIKNNKLFYYQYEHLRNSDNQNVNLIMKERELSENELIKEKCSWLAHIYAALLDVEDYEIFDVSEKNNFSICGSLTDISFNGSVLHLQGYLPFRCVLENFLNYYSRSKNIDLKFYFSEHSEIEGYETNDTGDKYFSHSVMIISENEELKQKFENKNNLKFNSMKSALKFLNYTFKTNYETVDEVSKNIEGLKYSILSRN